jgi:drug/metabolite transporter (DMT)-like permease
LLFVSSTPLLIVGYYLIRCKPVKLIEIGGVLLGFAGMVVICLGGKSNEGNSIIGDFFALLGAFFIWFHLEIAKNLLKDDAIIFLGVMLLFGAISALMVCILIAVIQEGASGFWVLGQTFGYFYEFDGIYALYLGVVPGFIGNGCLYYLLHNTSPLVTTIILFFEPVVGSIIAWIFGFQNAPNEFTWIGGAIITVGNFIVSVISKLKQEKIKEEEKNITEPLEEDIKNDADISKS